MSERRKHVKVKAESGIELEVSDGAGVTGSTVVPRITSAPYNDESASDPFSGIANAEA